LIVAGAAAVGFALVTLAVVIPLHAVIDFDATVSTAAHRTALAHPLWLATMRLTTRGGDTIVLMALAVLALAVLVWRRRWTAVGFLIGTVVVTAALRLTVLSLIARVRPADRLTGAGGWAYPSGHTTHSTLAALILTFLVWPLLKTRAQRVALIAVAVLWPLLVGMSRVALVVHWPTDVLGGWLLALTTVPAVAVAFWATASRPAAP
jgi:undecaprenyl-diphosphatase